MISKRNKFLLLFVFLPIALYISVYTWNWHTGTIDRFASYTGLEFVGWVLEPGIWVQNKTKSMWNNYIDLVDIGKENRRLREKLKQTKLQIFKLKQKNAEYNRLQELLKFSPPKDWKYQGARILAHELGPNAVLKTLLVSKGKTDGISKNTPVVTPEGVVGKVLRTSAHYSTVLLLTDPNSRIPVKGKKSRTNGIIQGQGPYSDLKLSYVPKNAQLFEEEILVTSGLGRIFPKGIPVARVQDIEKSDLSLFKQVGAKPVSKLKKLEEVLLIEMNSQIPKKLQDKFTRK